MSPVDDREIFADLEESIRKRETIQRVELESYLRRFGFRQVPTEEPGVVRYAPPFAGGLVVLNRERHNVAWGTAEHARDLIREEIERREQT